MPRGDWGIPAWALQVPAVLSPTAPRCDARKAGTRMTCSALSALLSTLHLTFTPSPSSTHRADRAHQIKPNQIKSLATARFSPSQFKLQVFNMLGKAPLAVAVLATAIRAAQPEAPAPVAAPMRDLDWGDLNFLHTTDTHGWHGGHLQEYVYISKASRIDARVLEGIASFQLTLASPLS